jgi:acetyl esterase
VSIAGRTYLERGNPVTVLIGWGPGGGDKAITAAVFAGAAKQPKQGPRNVAIRRGDGSVVVRPFRGLRKPPTANGVTQ